ncbi:MAG: IS607 family transposase [Alphaproteobacteria bacterium]|nr:MAG: IS607 family transposase [Alphaproteobacteria bacterium]
MPRVSTDLIKISEAAKLLGVSKSTLGRWHENGKFVADFVTPGGDRRWSKSRIMAMRSENPDKDRERRTIAYARVSTSEQKDDLVRQENMLVQFCAARGWSCETITDVGSGMNYNKRGLRKLLHLLLEDDVERLVLTHKDRLLRFGAELVFAICEERSVEVVIINRSYGETEPSFEEELAQDVLEIVTVFSARLYGARSRKNRKMIDAMKSAAADTGAE